MAKQNRFSFAFQAFVIGLVLVLVLSITRGAIYEEERRRAEYPSGISAVSVYRDYLSPAEPLPLELIREVVERGGMVTEYLPKALGATYDYLGTTPAYLEVFAPSLRLGRYFTEDDYMQPVCLVSEQVAKGLYGTIAESLGKTFKTELFPAGFEIIGVLEDGEKLPVQTVDEMGTELERFNISSNSFVIYPMSSVRMPIGFNAYRTVWVEGSPVAAAHLASSLEGTWEGLRFTVNPLPKTQIEDGQTKSLLIFILGGFAFLVLFVSALGFFGMQMIAVFRRKKEIGLRIAVGARPVDILLQVLLESGRDLLLPGLLGILTGCVVHRLLERALSLPMLFDLPLVLLSFLGLGVFTVLVGLYPAWKAATMDPTECLGKTPRLN